MPPIDAPTLPCHNRDMGSALLPDTTSLGDRHVVRSRPIPSCPPRGRYRPVHLHQDQRRGAPRIGHDLLRPDSRGVPPQD